MHEIIYNTIYISLNIVSTKSTALSDCLFHAYVIIKPRGLGLITALTRNWQSPSTTDSVSTVFKLRSTYGVSPILNTIYIVNHITIYRYMIIYIYIYKNIKAIMTLYIYIYIYIYKNAEFYKMLCCIFFVCKIMLKLCILNVKTRLLYYKPKLIIKLCPNVSEQGKTFLNLF